MTTLWCAGGLMLGVLLGSIGLAIAEREAPVEVLTQADAGQVAMHDNRLFLFYTINRTRVCRIETGRWLFTYVEHGGQRVRAMIPLEGGAVVPISDLGVASFILSLPLPPGLWPSDWYFITRSTDYCGPWSWLVPTRRESVPVRVNIEMARAAPDVPIVGMQGGKTIVRGRSPVAK